ncbi:rhamnogalacturonan acetylesterase [Chitinophaga polysaccharea]|uniref:rhamnogalacturonan acetylesterase n=1 Tax=Chitinophaga polysaccharea TaxID=1293035 RepID=UPI001C8D13BF|nr:rhamnogalacturonan acetylesterase [Chitinophaga polysaccharea]
MQMNLKKNMLPAALCLLLCSFIPQQKKINIFSIGDSTMCDYDEKYLSSFGGSSLYPIRGWMQMAREYFNGPVIIHNAARSGRSSKSYRSEGHWQKVIDSVQQGDYVFIMFGPNDQKSDTARHTDPRTTYRQNLIGYINETRAKGAHPVLFTSIVRRKFGTNGKLEDTLGDYIPVVRELAAEMKVPLVDLYKKSGELVESYGPEESKKLFVYIRPGVFPKLPEGKQDDTHLNERGATEIAGLAVSELKALGLPFFK